MFALLDAFESDLRNAIESYVTDHLSEEEALGGDYERVSAIRANEVGDEHVPIVHYLYLRQAYDTLSRNRSVLPGDLASELRTGGARLESIVPVRNRVMHGRPLHEGDSEALVAAVDSFRSRHWTNSRHVIERLANDPAWEPAFEAIPAPSERVLHNLPLADYDETGLVGRSVDVGKLKTLLQRGRESIITITGEGGIGKTALALEVAYAVVDDRETRFDCVLWVSLKSELLTASGVRQIADAVNGITGAARELGSAIDASFSGNIEELADALRGIAALVVIDNLESAQGDDILRLYDTLPESVTYLFTSRVGVGQIERRFPLGPLAAVDSELLLRKMATSRSLTQVSRLSSASIRELVDRLRNSPLAIKWYVLSIATGKDPLSVVRNQDELIDFCISSVYEALGSLALDVLTIMDALGRPLSIDELAIYCELTIDELRTAAQELNRGAMLVHEPDGEGGLFSRLGLSAAARMFLKRRVGRESDVAEVIKREQAYRKSVEKSKVDEASRRLGPNIVRTRSSDDEPVVHLLRLALSHSRAGDIEKSDELIERARALNPEYWEIDRVAAFIASSRGKAVEATALYRSALLNSRTDEERATVLHYLAGNLARKMHDVEGAIEAAIEAHEILNNEETALQLGNFLVWAHRFAEGQALIETTLETAQGKTYLIAATALVESWRRWSEALLSEHQVEESLRKASAGFVVGVRVLEEGYADVRLANEVIEAAAACMRAMASQGGRFDNDSLDVYLDWAEGRVQLIRASGVRALSGAMVGVSRERTCSEENRRRVERLVAEIDAPFGEGGRTLVGEVLNWRGRFGFIRHPDFPENIFFHRGVVDPPLLDALSPGLAVGFVVGSDASGKARADSVISAHV